MGVIIKRILVCALAATTALMLSSRAQAALNDLSSVASVDENYQTMTAKCGYQGIVTCSDTQSQVLAVTLYIDGTYNEGMASYLAREQQDQKKWDYHGKSTNWYGMGSGHTVRTYAVGVDRYLMPFSVWSNQVSWMT